jgi:predicted transcriptional regulator
MTVNRRRLLETLVSLSDEGSGPISVTQLATHLGADIETVREHVETLESYEMVESIGQSEQFKPTVTARDFLELEMDDDKFVIMEFPDDES